MLKKVRGCIFSMGREEVDIKLQRMPCLKWYWYVGKEFFFSRSEWEGEDIAENLMAQAGMCCA